MSSEKEPIFVIGYPKSGNTWLARLCSDALDSPIVTGNDPINQAGKKQNYAGEFVIYKAHYSQRDKPNNITQCSKILYIVRDFRDVLISSYFFNYKRHDENRVTLTSSRNLLNIIFIK